MSCTFATEPADDATVARTLRPRTSEVMRDIAPAIGPFLIRNDPMPSTSVRHSPARHFGKRPATTAVRFVRTRMEATLDGHRTHRQCDSRIRYLRLNLYRRLFPGAGRGWLAACSHWLASQAKRRSASSPLFASSLRIGTWDSRSSSER